MKKGKGLLKVMEEDGVQGVYNYKNLPSEKELKKIIEGCWKKVKRRRVGKNWVIYPYGE
jgi:hypothetical protein